MSYQNIARAKAIEQENKKTTIEAKLKKIPPTYRRYPLHSFEEQ